MLFYPRIIYPSLLQHLGKKQITVLTGMRRTGKTTLLRKLMDDSEIEQKVFFDLERIDYRELFSQKNYESIVHFLSNMGISIRKKTLIGIDEIQLVPNLPSVVKYLYDTYEVKFILTGSSSYYLKNRFNESLAGRKKIFEIFPLTFKEVCDFKSIPFTPSGHFIDRYYSPQDFHRLSPHYDDYIKFGGFPEVALAESLEDKKDILQDILSSYINYDLLALSDIKKSTEVYKLIKLLAARIGSKLEVSKLCNVSGLTRAKVENYLSLLEQSYLIQTIPVRANNPEREIVKAKKLYFVDTGLAALLTGLSEGAKFENAVFNQLSHWGNLAYYSLKTGKEIDFILEKTMAFEVKETASSGDLDKLMTLSRRLSISQNYVIGRRTIKVFPGYIWGGNIG